MKVRLLTGAVVAGSLLLFTTGAHAATKVLDGKKVKVLTLSATAAMQDHDADLATGQLPGAAERVDCAAPRCAVLPFVYQPAKGVKGNVAFGISWATPGADFDLYVAELSKGGNTQLATCGASVGRGEKLFLDASNFKAGKTYALIADFYRTPGEKVTGTVTMPGTAFAASPAAPADAAASTSCGL